jgi:hypothetical protein
MKRRPILWVLASLLALLLLCQACDLDRPKPDEKFYCKVDGKHWRFDNDGDFKAITLVAELTNQNRDLYIRASNDKLRESMSIIMANTHSIRTGVYKLSVITSDPTLPPSAHFYKNIGAINFVDYTTSKTYTGTFRILSLERDSRVPTSMIMRAEFEFTAVNPSGETVKITNGQFNGEVRISQ